MIQENLLSKAFADGGSISGKRISKTQTRLLLFVTEAEAMAAKIASNAPLAVRWANAAIKRGAQVDIESGIAIEADLFGMCFGTEDQKEGMAAFLEKRKAEFKGR